MNKPNGIRASEPATIAATCRTVAEELNQLRSAVASIVPESAGISFHFDDRLHINIELRDLHDLARAEILLPTIANGIFSNIQRSLAGRHPFRHRLTAEVDQ